MKSKSYKIDFEIYIVFIIVIGISVFNAIYSSVNISENQKSTSKIMTVDIPSLQTLENMNLLITRSKMYTTNWVYLPGNREDKEKLRILQNIEYPAIKSTLVSLMNDWDNKEDVDSMYKVFSDFEKLINSEKKVMNLLVYFDDYEDPQKRFTADEIIESEILPHSALLITMLNDIVEKKKSSTDIMHNHMRSSSRALMWGVLGLAILIVLVVLIAVFYMSNNVIVPTMKLKNIFLQMGRGEIPEINIKGGSTAVGQMTDAVKSLAASLKQTAAFAHDIGSGNLSVEFQPLSNRDELGNALVQMQQNLRRAYDENSQRSWISSGIAELNKVLRENTDNIDRLSDSIIATMVRYIQAYHGGLYLIDENEKEGQIRLFGGYAKDGKQQIRKSFMYGEGLIGQAIRDGEIIHLENVPNAHASIQCGLGNIPSTHLLIIPLRNHNVIFGAVEIARFSPFDPQEIEFLKSIGDTIGTTIASVKANTLTKMLLEETTKQAERLSAQEEELIKTNEELSNQSRLLQESEEELKQSNQEMKNKARELQQKNEILEQAREALSLKAKELEMNNKFKSEFLANMSHELRTPLNSVLILAKLLAENKESNLNDKQTEYARVIHKSGNDLLLLINDILDLSKIEAGKVELFPEETEIRSITDDIRMVFAEVANEKQINFSIEVGQDLPSIIITDKVRLEQVIKNLLSNAFKFTSRNGDVTFRIKRPNPNVKLKSRTLFNRKNVIELSVTDSGIGIAPEKQALIFEAFQQADGSTSRKYGGTGLGLSISKMLISMLGGEMHLESVQGTGSTFYVYIPVETVVKKINVSHETTEDGKLSNRHSMIPADDRGNIQPDDKVLLIVEDDFDFANILLEMARERKFKAVLASKGEDGLLFAEEYNPSAIIMDMQLQGMDGWTILNKIKANSKTSHIPVHVMSAMEKAKLSIDLGATAYLRKPLDKRDLDDAFTTIDKSIECEFKHVLVIEDMKLHQDIVRNLLSSYHDNAQIDVASDIKAALIALGEKKYDCIILDLDLGKGIQEGHAFLEKLKADNTYCNIPVIVFTASEFDKSTQDRINNLSQAVIPKNGTSFDKLIEETSQFLHGISEEQTKKPLMPAIMDDMLKNKTVLIVDDDMRNIYALTSVLEGQQMNVITACDGRDGLRKLEMKPDIILMDIMMPEMDGYTAMQEIRKLDEFKHLPIIALTAKAMVGDREKCIQSGASDYISKPVNVEKLFSIMRVWLYHE
jgi:signal transduction histidine kinase/CheY-like chemotaxis protein